MYDYEEIKWSLITVGFLAAGILVPLFILVAIVAAIFPAL